MEAIESLSPYETSPILSLFRAVLELQDFPECDDVVPAIKTALTRQFQAIPVKNGVRTYQKLVYKPSGLILNDYSKSDSVIIAPYDLTENEIKQCAEQKKKDAEREAKRDAAYKPPIDALKLVNPVYHLQFARMQKRRISMKKLVDMRDPKGFAFNPESIQNAPAMIDAARQIKDDNARNDVLNDIERIVETQYWGLGNLFVPDDDTYRKKDKIVTLLSPDDLNELAEIYAVKPHTFSTKYCMNSVYETERALSSVLNEKRDRPELHMPNFMSEPNKPNQLNAYVEWRIRQINRLIDYCASIYTQLAAFPDPDLHDTLIYAGLVTKPKKTKKPKKG